MTGHLPECPFGGDTDYSWLDECICDNLRACEARLFVDRTDHWNAALDAAWDAVAAREYWDSRDKASALAAIDALRGDPVT